MDFGHREGHGSMFWKISYSVIDDSCILFIDSYKACLLLWIYESASLYLHRVKGPISACSTQVIR